MIVYDVVVIVLPNHIGSYPPGRWFVDHRDTESKAQDLADRCNKFRFVETLHYEVETHDELSADRAPLRSAQ